MANLINNQYKNLASKGRYGDTMLAHINPQEAELLKSRGGSGTVNPQTGLPEFYSAYGTMYSPPVAPLPPPTVLAQAFNPDEFADIPERLGFTVVPQENRGMAGSVAAYDQVNPEYEQYATRIPFRGKGSYGGGNIDGYKIPTGKTFQGKPLIASYDAKGNFQYASFPEGEVYSPDPNRPNIVAAPKFNKTGGIIETGAFDVNSDFGGGGFGDFLSGFAEDFAPMIALGLGANYLPSLFSPSVSLAEAGVAAGGAGVSGGLMGSTLPAGAGAGGYYASGVTAGAATLGIPTMTGAPAGVTAGTSSGAGGAGMLSGSPVTPSAVTSPVTPPAVSSPVALPPAAGAGAAAGTSITSSMLSAISKATGIEVDTLKTFAPSVIQGLLSAGGSYLQSEQAKEAAQTQADAQIRAAQIAADAARFRPVGVTTRFGSSNFTTDAQGNVIGAGYTPSAEITGYQDRLRTLAGQGLTDAEGARAAYQPLTGAAQNLFSLGQGYLAKTPEQAAQDYISKQQALLAPSQQNRLAEVQNKLFQQGRGGAATAQGGNLMATSPELAAYYNSIAQQDLVLAAQADQEAQNRIKFGAGLFDTGAGLQGKYYAGQTAAYSPFTTAMDTSSGLESLAQVPLTLGTQIGARTTAASAEAGRLTGQGIVNAASTMAPANAYSLSGNVLTGAANSPNVTNAINNAFGIQPSQTTSDAEKIRLYNRLFGT